MSRHKNRVLRDSIKPSTKPQTPPPRKQRAADSYANPLGRLGFGQMNLNETAFYPMSRMTQNYAMLNSLYRTEWLAGRIIDTIPKDMTKNWYKITSQMQPDQIEAFETMERRLHIRQQILEGLKWGRLYGGAAGIMVIEGQEDMLDQPLDYNLILPGQFKGLIIADRWNGVYPDGGLVQDISDPDFGTPEYYNFSLTETDLANGIRVHHSRVLRFLGRQLPYTERIAENYWGMSEIEHVYNELNKRNNTSANVAHLIWQANIKTYKMGDLGEILAATDPNIQRELYQTIEMQNFLLSNMGLNVMDKDDEFQTNQYTFAGLSDVYELFMLDVAGAAEIPVTKLFGRSPAGMNSTGESDLTNYYDHVHQLQESDLRPVLEKLLPVMCISEWGAIPDDLNFEFEPVRDSSESERADLMIKYTQAIVAAYQGDIISQKIALKELRQTSSFTGAYDNITDEDIEAADGMLPDAGLEGFPLTPLAPTATPPAPPQDEQEDPQDDSEVS